MNEITEEQALEILRAADTNNRFSIGMERHKYWPQTNGSPQTEWSIIATATGGTEQHSSFRKTTLAEAVQEVAHKMAQPAAEKARKLREEAQALIAKADELEAPAAVSAMVAAER